MKKALLDRRPLPACAQDFIARTRVNASSLQQEMGCLAEQEVNPQAFADFCEQFAKGVHYIFCKYGTAPDRIVFQDTLNGGDMGAEPNTFAQYDPQTRTIEIGRDWCQYMINHSCDMFDIDLPGVKELDASGFITLVGVEEAYHHDQLFGGSPNRRQYMMSHYRTYREGDAKRENPLEGDADRILLKAAQEMGILMQTLHL